MEKENMKIRSLQMIKLRWGKQILVSIPLCAGWGREKVFPTSISNSWDIRWVSYSSTQFLHYLPSTKLHRLRDQSYKTPPPLLVPLTSPGCYLCFQPTGNRSEGSKTLLHFTYRIVCLSQKRYNSGRARWKKCMGQGVGKRMEFPCPLQEHCFPSTSVPLPTWSSPNSVHFGILKRLIT